MVYNRDETNDKEKLYWKILKELGRKRCPGFFTC